MKKVILSVAVAGALLAPSVFAQSKSFEGFSVGLSANFNNAKNEATGINISESSTTAGLKAAYGWGMSNTFILSLGASYDMGNIKAGTDAGTGVSFTDKGLMVVSIEPGFKVSNTALVYAKLGYAMVKSEVSGTSNGSTNYDGTAYGLGVRSMLGKNWSLDLEAQQIDFDRKNFSVLTNNVKPSATVVSLGVNYHF